MSAMAFQITSLMIVYSTINSGPDQRKHQSPSSLAFVHKGPVTRKLFPFDAVIMCEFEVIVRKRTSSLPQ